MMHIGYETVESILERKLHVGGGIPLNLSIWSNKLQRFVIKLLSLAFSFGSKRFGGFAPDI